jgi:chromosome segregation ATPase
LFAEAGPFDTTLPFFEDWDFLIRLSAITPFHHLPRVTCEYRHFRGGSHHVFGERPRERADFLEVKARVLAKHAAELRPDVLARAVDVLRAELVAEREVVAAVRRDFEVRLDALQGDLAASRADFATLERSHASLSGEYHALMRERVAQEERYHALNGELAAVRDEHGKLRTEVQRLYDDEGKLRAAVDDQTAHLGRTYAEIERLNGIIREMESTRAWRLHTWLGRRSS